VRADLIVDVARDYIIAPERDAEELFDPRTDHADFGAAVRIVVTVSE